MTRFLSNYVTATAVAALLALGTGGAWAQSSMSSSPPPSRAPSSGMATTPATIGTSSSSAIMKNPLASEDTSQIDGVAVAGSDGSNIGKISTVLMNPSSKRVDRLVVAEGGVLGVGAHDVALPVDSFRWDAQKRNFVIGKTADDLKAMPEWHRPQLAENPNADTSTAPDVHANAAGAPIAPAMSSTGGH